MRMFGMLAVLTLSMSALAADTDVKLDGKWSIVSMERDGKADAAYQGAERVQNGALYTVTMKDGKSVPGMMKVDATKGTMDMMPKEGRYKDKTLEGIYKLEGETLTVCFAEPGKPRPTKFESGAGVVLVVHKKLK